MKRRTFIAALGGAVAAWPLVGHAQKGERMRRIGVLLPAAADDTHYQTWLGAFQQGLSQSGWNIGQNVLIDTRWATANADDVRRNAAELVALAPDVIFAPGGRALAGQSSAERAEPRSSHSVGSKSFGSIFHPTLLGCVAVTRQLRPEREKQTPPPAAANRNKFRPPGAVRSSLQSDWRLH